MSVRTTLEKARALIADPKHWTKRELAVDRKGLPVSTGSPSAKCFCSVGAIMRAAGGPSDPNYDDARAVLMRVLAPRNLIEFNDAPDTRHEDVLGLFEKAIAACAS